MKKKDIINYVMTTKWNVNPRILWQMLDELKPGSDEEGNALQDENGNALEDENGNILEG